MRPKRAKNVPPAALVPPVVSGDDRTVLTAAYKAGLILAWKRDTQRGYCLTLAGRPDEYVDVDQLTTYLERLKPR
jgi:hypothetical protein